MFFAYILRSQKDNKYYYGSCQNIKERLKSHNAGKVRSTKGRRPFVVWHAEEFASRGEAVRRELFFKSIDGYNWLKNNQII
ncbi:MAG: GIY-YIG nuclease family protein [Flavobacteriales bacterium]|nr:GIY-YIG nuclease family protein [Flavobacteriales bacterium]PCH89192.1 MAG: endonuclease [Flavobacteriales bacterium]